MHYSEAAKRRMKDQHLGQGGCEMVPDGMRDADYSGESQMFRAYHAHHLGQHEKPSTSGPFLHRLVVDRRLKGSGTDGDESLLRRSIDEHGRDMVFSKASNGTDSMWSELEHADEMNDYRNSTLSTNALGSRLNGRTAELHRAWHERDNIGITMAGLSTNCTGTAGLMNVTSEKLGNA